MIVPEAHRHQVLEGDAPAWTTRYEMGQMPAGNADGSIYPPLLIDSQRNLETDTHYLRFVYFLPNIVSVQEHSRIEIVFQPESQQVILHNLAIHRQGEVIDLLPNQEARVLSREEQMERFVFDGCLQAIFLLNDVRAGDVVEYSYSRQAIKPPLLGKSSGLFLVRGNPAPKASRARLVYRPDRNVYVHAKGPTLTPQSAYTPEGLIECCWHAEPIGLIGPDSKAPDSQLVFYGEFASWEEVAEAESKLYVQIDEPLPSHLAGWVEQVKQAAGSPEEFILQIIRYVQESIRYVSVSIDEHTRKPHDILTVLEKNYGDCKDKAVLLTRLLRGAGFDALPALVHSRFRDSTEGLPWPGAFDHVIVRLCFEDKVYWIDGTRAHQGGGLEQIGRCQFGSALVLGKPGMALEATSRAATTYQVDSHELIKVHQHDGTAELKATHVYSGSAADDIRHQISRYGVVEIEKHLLAAYREVYPEVTLLNPVSVADRRDENKVTMVHHFMLARMWKPLPQSGRLNQAYFAVLGIRRACRLPQMGERSQTFRIPHPVSFKASLELRVPTGLGPKRGDHLFNSAGFRCTQQLQASSSVARVDFHYISKKDQIKPSEMAQYEQAVHQLINAAGVTVTLPELRVQQGWARRPAH